MERKSNELEIKQGLLSQLSKITISSNGNICVVMANNGKKEITVSKNYDVEKFRFIPGQFVQIAYGCSCHPQNKIALCVGVGKGCPNNEESDEFWFLLEEGLGVSHFCGSDASKFNEVEKEGDLILLDPIS